MKSKILIALFLAAATALAVGALVWHTAPITHKAPDVSYTLLDGRVERLDALRGKVVLVNFWATTCATCVRKMPELVATHEKYNARGLETLAVAMPYDPPARVSQFAESRRLPFGVVIDNTGAMSEGFGPIEATPTTLLIDKRGEVVRRWVGEPSFEVLHSMIEKLLAQS